jgi:AcrR family transcriptional regulator
MVLPVKANPGATPGRAPDVAPTSDSRHAHADEVTRVLDAAEELFYARGIQTVGMDDIRDRARVSLKRLYQCFSSKQELLVAVLERRDAWWRASLSEYVSRTDDRQARILAVFDWLGEWFSEPGFRGCAWINSYGELGAVSAAVADHARRHKTAFKRYLGALVADAGFQPELTDQLTLMAEGAMAEAGIFATPSSASHARAGAEALLRAARPGTRKPAARRRASTGPRQARPVRKP